MAGISNKRQRMLARQKYERYLERRATRSARARRRHIVQAVVVVSALVVVGVGTLVGSRLGADRTETEPAAASTTSAGPYTPTGDAAKPVQPPEYDTAAAARPYTATIKTNQGSITLEALTDQAPYATYSLRHLAEADYFDGTSCHRLTSGGLNVLQCGDPTGTGSGGPGYAFPDENLTAFGEPGADGTVTYPKGTVAMANSGPGTNGSQFFIVYADSKLPPNYTPFATVTDGLDVVEKVGQAGSEPPGDGKPKQAVTIQDVTVVQK